jgi:peptidoglycan/xylan/chitin deacetylase (PgdA/CDA1 family)
VAQKGLLSTPTKESPMPASDGHKTIALTFDDGPDPTWTPQVLKVLQDYGVKATFFELGENIEANPDLAKAVVAAGHLVENHTFDHPHLPTLTAAQITTEIQRTSDDIFKFTGTKPEYVRPPYGEVNQKVENSIESMHLKTALWTVDTNDWQVDDGVNVTEQQIINTVLSGATDNGIVLMHDAGGDRHLTVAALDNIIEGLHNQGYELVTLDQIPTLPPWDLFA